MTSYITITNCHISVIIIQLCIIIEIVEGSERNNVITTCLTYIDPNDNT